MSIILLKQKIDILEKVGIEKQVESSLNKLIYFQQSKYEKFINDIDRELNVFESAYHLTSSEFYKKYNLGEIGDAGDYIEWAALCENLAYYREKISLLKSAA